MSKQLSKSEIFNKVFAHLSSQKRAAKNKSGICQYRTQNGKGKNMCAVGCLIPEKNYDSNIEGNSIENIYNDPHLWKSIFKGTGINRSNPNLYLLDSMQFMHDIILAHFGFKPWQESMLTYAKLHNIKVDPI